MSRRIISLFLALFLITSLFAFSVFASEQASAYIFCTSASVSQGSSSGKISIDYSITGMNIMDVIGVFKIVVYNSNGTKYKTIYGSVLNGLLVNNSVIAMDSYETTCVAGQVYYCEVTLLAAKDGGYDTRTIRTGTVTAPSSP